MVKHLNTVVIGGGQAGLAVSNCLMKENLTHVVLERHRVGERWRSCSWDSLRLLTPNWQTRLPGGWKYTGNDVDGFMKATEFVVYLEEYAKSFPVPLCTETTVVDVVQPNQDKFLVKTSSGDLYSADNVVVATGHCDVPRIPQQLANGLNNDIVQLHSSEYKNVAQLPSGNVLVVGAGASGTQIAEEIAKAGRQVTIAVGTHTRYPRTYRNRDFLWWLDNMGAFMAPADQEVEEKFPGPQLSGALPPHTVDLNNLSKIGVRLVGKVTSMNGNCVKFDNGLAARAKRADDEMMALLAKVDEYGLNEGYIANVNDLNEQDQETLSPTRVGPYCVEEIDLQNEQINCIVWATGFNRDYSFLQNLSGALNERGDICNQGGIASSVEGLYVVGMRWMRRKGSHLIDGVGHDAQDLVRHILSRRTKEEEEESTN